MCYDLPDFVNITTASLIVVFFYVRYVIVELFIPFFVTAVAEVNATV